MTIDLEDTQQLLAEVDRFARQRIALATARPEAAISPSTLQALTHEAQDLGLLPRAHGEDGFALWEHLHSPHAQALNTGILSRVARANAGVAFAWHRAAMASAVARELGCARSAHDGLACNLVSTGHYGLARTSLARWFKSTGTPASTDPETDDTALLSDWLNRRDHDSVLVAPHAWQTLLWPVWLQGEVRWQTLDRSQLQEAPAPGQHGLDETLLARFATRGSGYRPAVPGLPEHYQRLKAGDNATVDGKNWQILIGQGHAPDIGARFRNQGLARGQTQFLRNRRIHLELDRNRSLGGMEKSQTE